MHHKRLMIESEVTSQRTVVREHGVLGSRRVDGPTAEAGGE